MTDTKQVFIEGTGHTPDYLVIAKHGNVRLAIKPLVENFTSEDCSHLTMIGFRLRSVPAEGATASPDELTEAWPDIEFLHHNAERASCTMGTTVNKETVNTPLSLKDFLETTHVAHDYAAQLEDLLGKSLVETPFTIEQFLSDVYAATVDKSFPEDEFDTEAKKLGCKVIDLQSASLARGLAKSKLN